VYILSPPSILAFLTDKTLFFFLINSASKFKTPKEVQIFHINITVSPLH